jgi:hypothetical protein
VCIQEDIPVETLFSHTVSVNFISFDLIAGVVDRHEW